MGFLSWVEVNKTNLIYCHTLLLLGFLPIKRKRDG